MNRTFFTPDSSGAAPTPAPPKTRRVQSAFNKKTMAALDECEEVAQSAQIAPYADILNVKYKITPARVAALLDKIAQCETLFGTARTSNLGSQTQTEAKDAAKEDIIEAIDEFRTGARLSFQTDAELSAFAVGVDIEKNESILTQLAQSILDNPASPTLTGIGPDEIATLQSALTAWKTASQNQLSHSASGQGNRAQAGQLFDEIEDEARRIKIAIDGKFSYKKPDSTEARKLFHLPLNRPFAPKMG